MVPAITVCIRFEQIRAPRQEEVAAKTRQQIRAQFLIFLNEIQCVCGSDTAPFEATDISYVAYVNKADRLEGIITIQKRTKERLEDGT